MYSRENCLSCADKSKSCELYELKEIHFKVFLVLCNIPQKSVEKRQLRNKHACPVGKYGILGLKVTCYLLRALCHYECDKSY